MTVVSDIRDASAADCAATIGFFDGVHRGHRFLIDQVRAEAEKRGLASQIITFADHPQRTLRPDFRPQLLTLTPEKLQLLEATGVDRCVLLPFSREMAALPARTFMQEYLHERLRVRTLVIGYDHRFGHGRSEGFADYAAYGQQMGIEVVQALPFAPEGLHISSSTTRKALAEGDVALAERLLGRPYALTGRVVDGRRVGRSLGFPTANLQPESDEKLIPANGVYAVEAETGGQTYAAMLNIGSRPTLDNGTDRTIEAHLLGFSGSLYGRSMTLRFRYRLRDERTFASLDALTAQLRLDAAQTTRLLP